MYILGAKLLAFRRASEVSQGYLLDTPGCSWFSSGLSPLILASIEGNLDVMTQLLEQRADVNQARQGLLFWLFEGGVTVSSGA